MKTAVSVPNDVYERVEQLARSAGRSRSEVYSAALREYVARHSADDVTEAINRVVIRLGSEPDSYEFAKRAARQTLDSVEW